MNGALCFLERAARTWPARTAIVDEYGSVTFAELQRKARCVGSALIASGHANKYIIVAMEKSADTVAVMLGVLYAGGCYVPVDPISVPARLASICRILPEAPVVVEAGTRALVDRSLTESGVTAAGMHEESGATANARAKSDETVPVKSEQGHTTSNLLSNDVPNKGKPHLLDADALFDAPLLPGALADVACGVLDIDPAYILFTSGSTGTPKGVMVSHRGIVDFITGFTSTFGIDETDVVGNQAPFDFDVSVKDIYGSLAAGAELVILPRRLFVAPAELVQMLAHRRVTTLTWAVAALCLISGLHALDSVNLPDVRRVLFSGETMPLKHLAIWMERLPHAQFVNLYGPTEVTCNCLYHPVDRTRNYEEGIPLGTELPNHAVLLLDEQQRPVTQAGAVGELYVRGCQLALGYVGNEAATRHAFVANPLCRDREERVYRTGDLAEITEAGELLFRGRRDNQIKHQGHRIELEEIDLALERLDEVRRCRCAYDVARHRICAFYEGDLEEKRVAEAAAHALPPHLMPSLIRRVDAMPLTKNGKVDRKALLTSAPRRQRHV